MTKSKFLCDIAQTLDLKKDIFHEYPPEGRHLQIVSGKSGIVLDQCQREKEKQYL